jgi:Rrf2 family protein
MKLSASTRYAVRILSELAQAGTSVPIAALAENAGLSLRVVENITAKLRAHGITSSVLGAGGGITLSVPLSKISLGKLITLFEGGVQFAVCHGDKANDCPNQTICERSSVWRKISAKIQTELDSISLGEILMPK